MRIDPPVARIVPLAAVGVFVAGCASTSVPAPVSQRPPPSERPRAAAVVPAPAPVAAKPAVAPAVAAPLTRESRPETHRVRKGDTLISIALEYGLDPRELAAWNRIDNPNLIRVGQELRLRAPGSDPAPAAAMPSGPTSPAPAAVTGTASAARPAGTEGVRTEPRALRQPFSERALAEASAPARRAPPAASGAAAPVQGALPGPAAGAPPAVAGVTAGAPEPGPAGRPGEPAVGAAAARAWIWPTAGQVIERFSETNRGIDIGGRTGQPILASADGRVVYSGAGIRGYGRMLIVKHDDVYVSVYAHASELLVKEGQAVTRGQRIAEMGSSDTDRVKLHFEIRRMGRPVDPLTYLPSPGAGS